MQQILLRTAEYSAIATMNLNVDSISDALTAQVGGIGAAPGPNQSDSVACFEATYGTVPKCTDKDNTNAGSETLSAELRPRHRAWKEAADLILRPLETAMLSKNVTCWRPELTGAVYWSGRPEGGIPLLALVNRIVG